MTRQPGKLIDPHQALHVWVVILCGRIFVYKRCSFVGDLVLGKGLGHAVCQWRRCSPIA